MVGVHTARRGRIPNRPTQGPKTITEFDANRFGWKSLTPAVNGFHAGTVELQRDVKGDTPGMQFAEIVSELGEYAIY